MIEILEGFFIFLTSFIIVYMVRHYIFTLAIVRQAKKGKICPIFTKVGYTPSVTVLVPARNEERVIGRLLQRMTELSYPKDKLQIIVVNDGSTDGTGTIVELYSKRFKYIQVIHRNQKDGGTGKTSAMNVGFKRSNGEIILCFDADYYPQTDIIEKLMAPFANPIVGAVQGRVVVLNEPQNIITRLVALERIGGYRVDQEARGSLGLIAQFGGTVGGLRRVLLEKLGGWDESVLAEDTDLTFRVYLEGYKVAYVGNAECYEEAVDNLKAYWNQRYRWARGHMQCCFRHFGKVLKSSKLKLREKIDGLLLLNVYFMPLISLLSFVLGIALIFKGASPFVGVLWFSVPVSFYSFVGNFAPFFEVGIGAHMDGRSRIQWLIPLLMFTFIYNILICSKAFFDLALAKARGRNRTPWAKTVHLGNGNYYIGNNTIMLERSP